MSETERNEWGELVMKIKLPETEAGAEEAVRLMPQYAAAARYVGWFFGERARLGCDMNFDETMEEFARNVHMAMLAEAELQSGGPH